jgi:hypothetical protein
LRFEAEALARAEELTGQVSRLAVVDTPGAEGWHEAQYTLSDGARVELRQESYTGGLERIIFKVRVSRPPVEVLGADRVLRRVTLMRNIVYKRLFDRPNDDMSDTLESQFLPEYTEMMEMHELSLDAGAEIEQARLEDQMRPDYHPDELIRAITCVSVERNMPHGPNFRTEQYTDSMPPQERLAHMEAREVAGEPATPKAYDIAEHNALMALLDSIDPEVMEPAPLDDEWTDPPATLRTWRPKE